MKKIRKVLIHSLSYLYFNNISVSTFFKASPFPKESLSKERSHEYFEYIKFKEEKKLGQLLNDDKEYIFQKDYFNQTGYHWAAKRAYLNIMLLLISFGKHVNQVDKNMRTPLYLAAKSNLPEALGVIEVLIAADANPFMANKDGKLPLDVCVREQSKDLLRKYMDKVNMIRHKNFFKLVIVKYHNEHKETQRKPTKSNSRITMPY